MDRTYWITDNDEKGRYKFVPPATYFCVECRKQVEATSQYVNDEIMYKVRPCKKCGCIIVGSM